MISSIMGWTADGRVAMVAGASTALALLTYYCVAYRVCGNHQDGAAMDKLVARQAQCSECGSKKVQAVLFDKDTTDNNHTKLLYFCVNCKPGDGTGGGENEESCSICFTTISSKTGLYCIGCSPHFICESCFQGYARTAFEEGTGALARRIEKSSRCISKVGELPCPLFPANCDCAALSRSSVAKVLSEESLNLQVKAEARIAVSIADEERRQQQQAAEEREATMRPLQFVRQAVIEALDLGSRMTCPNCRIQGEKDERCIHMKCEGCHVRWCYACGRQRGLGAGNCNTCDKGSGRMYLQENPGWGRLHDPLLWENPAKGALHELHRRRMAYFLRLVKETSGGYWQEFLASKDRELLVNVPTRGRRISESEIQIASPPLFGLTKVQDLRWDDEMQPILDRLRSKLPPTQQQTFHRQDPQQPKTTPNERTALINDVLLQGSGSVTENLLNQLLDAEDSERNQEEQSCKIQ